MSLPKSLVGTLPAPPPWTVAQVIVALFVGYWVFPLLMVLVLVLGAHFFTGQEPSAGAVFMVHQVWVVLTWALIFSWMMKRYRLSLADWSTWVGLQRQTSWPVVWGQGLLGVMVVLSLGALLTWVMTQTSMPRSNPYILLSQEERIVLVGFAIMTAPVLEEVVFRGLLQGALVPSLGRIWGIGITTVTFAAFHLTYLQVSPFAMIYVALLGFSLSVMRDRTGSVLPGIFAHLFNNMLSAFGLFLMK